MINGSQNQGLNFGSVTDQVRRNLQFYRGNQSFPAVRDVIIGYLLVECKIKFEDVAVLKEMINYMLGETTTNH